MIYDLAQIGLAGIGILALGLGVVIALIVLWWAFLAVFWMVMGVRFLIQKTLFADRYGIIGWGDEG